MAATHQPRVFLGITEIAGYYGNLAQGFAALGVRATAVDLLGNRFQYGHPAHCPGWINAVSNLLGKVRGGATHGLSPRKVCWGIARQVAALAVMVWAIPRHDVFVFSWGTTFARGYDLRLLRRLGKTTVLVFHGTDARPPYLSPARQPPGPPDGARLARQALRTKRLVRRLERHADHVICHPGYGHFLSEPMIMFVAVGIPFCTPDHAKVDAPASRIGAIRVLHAPSSSTIKGTELIRAAVSAVRDQGANVELVEISGRPHAEVLDAIQRCDVVVDQAYSDTPMAGLATEASACGRAALVGGYELSTIEAEQDAGRPCPTVTCTPAALQATLHALVSDEPRRQKVGAAAAAFVAEHWSPERVAERYLQIISGSWPNHLMRDPADIRYVHGCGLSAERSRAAIRAVVDAGGADALQLGDKPELLTAVLRHAGLSAQDYPA